LGLVAVRINRDTDYETRLVALGDYLSYHTDVAPGSLGNVYEFARPAVYALAEQRFGNHDIWLSFGRAFEGTCAYTGGQECTTTGLGAIYPSAGYKYQFAESASIYALGYYVVNDVSARYTSFPMLEAETNSVDGLPNLARTSAGSDTFGIGLGFVYTFNVKLLGGDGAAPTKKVEPKPAQVAKPAAPPPEEKKAPAAEEPAPADDADAAPENVELQDEPEGEAPPAP
jgi:hypothetical protein